MLLEVEAEIKQRLSQHAFVVQDQGDQQSADAPVAIEKRMDGLELHVRQGGFGERGERYALIVQVPLEVGHARLHASNHSCK